MILVTSNKPKQLLQIRYVGRVQPDEFQQTEADFRAQLAELSPGFNLLTDFSQMEFMPFECGTAIGRMMEAVDQVGVSLVVRVIPDPSRDIGMNILTAFHYSRRPRIVTCANLMEAARALGL